jgi:hypothetical protein
MPPTPSARKSAAPDLIRMSMIDLKDKKVLEK